MKKGLIFALIFIFLLTSGISCLRGGQKKAQEALAKPVKLSFWGVFDEEDAYSQIISAYRQLHPNISVEYKKFRYEEYENELLEAFAEDRGPDIFMVHNTSLKKYLPLIQPMPEKITLPYIFVKGTIKKEQVAELRTTPTPSLREFKTNFIDQVYDDAVVDNKIYGLPLSVDTLVLYYNRDLLNKAGIPQPPLTWKEFRDQVIKLVRQDKMGNILQAGAAFGTAKNVERSFDILSLLMMQNGTQMKDDFGNPIFDRVPPGQKLDFVPGVEALKFYTDFASPQKEVYTWNSKMPNSFEAFVSGKVAFFFGYSYHLPLIKAQAPKLNLGISKVPQIEGNPEINYANYWLNVVSKKTKHSNEAWGFLLFASKKENVISYLSKTRKPTALRNLIPQQLKDDELYFFASELLTAKSWYQGKNFKKAEEAFEEMIESVVQGEYLEEEAISLARQKIAQTIR